MRNLNNITLAALSLFAISAQASVINDGTTTADLTVDYLSSELSASATTTGTVVQLPTTALNPGSVGNNVYAVVAYENTAAGLVGNSNYTVSANYTSNYSAPSGGHWETAGGVAGWFDPTTGQGISLSRAVYSEEVGLRVLSLDGPYYEQTETTGLFLSDGSAYADQDVPTFDRFENTTFTLEFEDPTAADLLINPSFTTKITASVDQASTNWSDTFFTTLAAPSAGNSRVGYYSFRITGSKDTFTIGDFDDLTLTVIPEPSTLLVAVFGLAVLMIRRRF